MLENLSNYQIVLGSHSPRRRELISGLDIPYQVIALPDVDENYPDHLQKEEIPVYRSFKGGSLSKNDER